MNKTQKILLSLAILAVISISGFLLGNNSRKDSIENKMQSYILKSCSNTADCKIKLSDFTDFEWDKFYYIENGALLLSKKDEIGINFPKEEYDRLLSAKLIFVKNGEMVHFERIEMSPDYIYKNTVVFDNDKYEFTPTDSLFYVRKNQGADGEYFSLIQSIGIEKKSFSTTSEK